VPAGLHVFGKRPAAAGGQLNAIGGLTCLRDDTSCSSFLVDTGAAVSVLPHHSTSPPSTTTLTGADGRPIPSWGATTRQLCFGARMFLCTFILAAVSRPILGSDFLSKYRLLVDSFSRTVLCSRTLKPLGPPSVAFRRSPFIGAVARIPAFVRELLARFPSITTAVSGPPSPKHGVQHSIETQGRPVFAKARRLDPQKLAIAEAEFRALEKAGVVRRSDSPWASPLHMVPKPDGMWRPCGDYRRLNLATTHDCYPLPNIMDFSGRLAGCTVFSTVDLVKGYHQVPMAAADVPKTAIITPFGLFEYLFMPFGLRNAAQTFQRLMDQLFRHLPFVFTYLDDHLIASRSAAEHKQHLEQFFKILSENGLRINPAKCVFAAGSVKFLGHTVGPDGVRPLGSHVEALAAFPQPTSVKELQRFLGIINFYRRFLPGIAGTLQPLTDALRGDSKSFQWSPLMAAAFQAAKAALAAATPLSHPRADAAISVSCDASDTHIGAVLQQSEVGGGGWQPLAFFSRKLTPTEQRYSVFDRELLAAFAAVRHFRFAVEGRRFTIFTDHKPLVAALKRVSPPWSAHQQRQLAYLAEFTEDFRHCPGSQNVIANALSRPYNPPPPPAAACAVTAVTHTAPAIDYTAYAAAQKICPSITALKLQSSLSVVYRLCGDIYLYGDVSTGCFRPLVPVDFRRAVFDSLHGGSHPGIRASRRLVSSGFVWSSLAKDVTAWARECLACQRAKTHRHVDLRPAAIPVPSRRFAHLHIDLVGPLPLSHGCQYLFTIIDRTTRWPEAIPLAATSTADCARALVDGWISRYGLPAVLTSDRGPQFTSAIWAALCSWLNIQHNTTTAYHPQSNGLVERLHRRLKDAFRARLAGPDWVEHLPWILLHLRATARDNDGRSPAESVYGAQLVLPGQLLSSPDPPPTFFDTWSAAVDKFSPAPPRHNQSASQPPPTILPDDLLAARMVLVRCDGGGRPPLSPRYPGPYLVLARSPHFFKLQIGTREELVSTHRLKPAFTADDTPAAEPPRRGRPPNRRVSFRLPIPSSPSSSSPAAPTPTVGRQSGRLRRPPLRFSPS
jgi:RNase H-like domain found in reverse transcriptase/Reverse transcriptase (RNA-dependent DNA polymerase)/Integrase core domain/Integrase zinc binding domain